MVSAEVCFSPEGVEAGNVQADMCGICHSQHGMHAICFLKFM